MQLLKGSTALIPVMHACHDCQEATFENLNNVAEVNRSHVELAGVLYMDVWQMSHEKNPGCLGYVGDYTIQLYRDYPLPFSRWVFPKMVGENPPNHPFFHRGFP